MPRALRGLLKSNSAPRHRNLYSDPISSNPADVRPSTVTNHSTDLMLPLRHRKRFATALLLFLGTLAALPAQAQQATPQEQISEAVRTLSEAVDELTQAADELERMVGEADAARSSSEIGRYLQQIDRLSQEALQASQAAEKAESVEDVKKHADKVFALIWGVPSGLTASDAMGEANMHGWKTRWQTTYSDFDSSFAARYGDAPPEITDPQQLGIIGRGLYVRDRLQAIADDSTASEDKRQYAEAAISSLNNGIGWMKMDDGVTKGERQPRVDLTREWDAPVAFWLSTSDTGWLYEVYSQALNILKTDYEGDVAMAQEHAAGMTTLLNKYLEGEDANGDGTVEPAMMEGGLNTALDQAKKAGFATETTEKGADE